MKSDSTLLKSESEDSCEQVTIQQMQSKFSAMVPVIKDLYSVWIENHDKLDILEECELMLQMFEKITSKENGATTRWNIKKPRSKEAPNPTVPIKKEQPAAVLGDSRVRRMGESLSSTESLSKELTLDEKERLRIFKKRTKGSRDKIIGMGSEVDRKDERVARLTRSAKSECESVDIKVYINDLKYRIFTVYSTHSKSDLCQLAIKAFNLDQSNQYTLSLWRDFKHNLEIKESVEASPFKLYFKEVANDPSKLFHIHRAKAVQKKTKPQPVEGANMENWKVPEGATVTPFPSPKRDTQRRNTVGNYGINSTSKQSPPSITRIKAIFYSPPPTLTSSDKSDKSTLALKNSFKPPMKINTTPSSKLLQRNKNTTRGDLSPSSSNI